MKDTNLDDLIDAFLKKNISADQRQQLEQFIKADPAIKRQLEDSKTTYEYLEYLRYKEIRKKLRHADRLHKRGPQKTGKTGWFISVTIFVFLITCITLVRKYQAEHVAISHFEYFSNTPLTQVVEYQLHEAEKLFAARQYKHAAIIYSAILSIGENQTASWNLAMCELADKGYTQALSEKINAVAVSGDEKWEHKRNQIKGVFKNPIFRWLNPTDGTPLPPIKPRIM